MRGEALRALNWQRRQLALAQRAATARATAERPDTWWTSDEAQKTRAGFTALARQHVRPTHETGTIYKFREQGD